MVPLSLVVAMWKYLLVPVVLLVERSLLQVAVQILELVVMFSYQVVRLCMNQVVKFVLLLMPLCHLVLFVFKQAPLARMVPLVVWPLSLVMLLWAMLVTSLYLEALPPPVKVLLFLFPQDTAMLMGQLTYLVLVKQF